MVTRRSVMMAPVAMATSGDIEVEFVVRGTKSDDVKTIASALFQLCRNYGMAMADRQFADRLNPEADGPVQTLEQWFQFKR